MGHSMGHGSMGQWVMGHKCDGSDGSWVTNVDPWSTLAHTSNLVVQLKREIGCRLYKKVGNHWHLHLYYVKNSIYTNETAAPLEAKLENSQEASDCR